MEVQTPLIRENPELHDEMVHFEATQDPNPLGNEQTFPAAPLVTEES